MLALALMSPVAVLACDLPRWAAWPLAILVMVAALALARREWRGPVVPVVIDGAGTALVDGREVSGFHVAWRGPIAFVSWRDSGGAAHRHGLWPDTLPPALRRELRLAAPGDGAVRRRDSVAP